MNITGFQMPTNSLCDGCNGRWALDPSLSSLKDDTFDIDNDTLPNGMEAPDRWDTNPVDDDTDGDMLPDGWEVYYSQLAFENGLADNETVGVYGARGVMDPAMPDSDLDGIDDGFEDPDMDGLNRTGLIKRYCPVTTTRQTRSATLTPTPLTGNASTITSRITRTSKKCKTAPTRSPTTPTVMIGTMVLRCTTKIMMTTVWRPDGNITSSSIPLTEQTAWWTPMVTAT